MGRGGDEHIILVGKTAAKKPLGRNRYIQENNIRIDVLKLG